MMSPLVSRAARTVLLVTVLFAALAASGCAFRGADPSTRAEALMAHPPLELRVRLHLIERFEPGVRGGMPGPVPEDSIAARLEADPVMTEFVRRYFSPETDLATWERLEQLHRLGLTPVEGGFEFSFTSDKPCELIYRAGRVVVDAAEQIRHVELIQERTSDRPC